MNVGLHGRSERTLAQVASFVAGVPCDVQVSRHATAPASVVAADCVLVLDPERVHLGHLLVGAALLRRRAEIESLGPNVKRAAVRPLVAAARAEVAQRFPRARAFVDGVPPRGLEVVWDKLRLRPLEAADFASPGRTEFSTRVFGAGDGDGLAALCQAARDGLLPAYRFDAFPELDVVHTKMRMTRSGATETDRARLQDWHRLAPDVIAGGARCFRDSSQILVDEVALPSLTTRGIQVADDALHDAFLASRAHVDLPVFTVEETDPILRFDPERFIVATAVDMGGLPNGGLLSASPSSNMVSVFCRIWQALGVPVLVVGFWDHAVPMPGGRSRYLCVEVTAKDFEEPFDDAAALRMMRLMDFEAHERPSSVCHPALHRRILLERLVPEAKARGVRHASVYYFGTRWSEGGGRSSKRAPERMAQAIEADMARARTEVAGKWEGLEALPEKVWRAAPGGGWIAEHRFRG